MRNAPADAKQDYPATPDGRYFVVRGRLWRKSDPRLSASKCEHLVSELMSARRAVAYAMKQADAAGSTAAHARVDEIKHLLGERGPVWWSDDAPDYNRRMAKNTPYAEWYLTQNKEQL